MCDVGSLEKKLYVLAASLMRVRRSFYNDFSSLMNKNFYFIVTFDR